MTSVLLRGYTCNLSLQYPLNLTTPRPHDAKTSRRQDLTTPRPHYAKTLDLTMPPMLLARADF